MKRISLGIQIGVGFGLTLIFMGILAYLAYANLSSVTDTAERGA